MNNKTNLQFTELTQDDINTHEDLYIGLLVSNGWGTLRREACKLRCKKYSGVYREYAITEVLKSKKLFQEMFR